MGVIYLLPVFYGKFPDCFIQLVPNMVIFQFFVIFHNIQIIDAKIDHHTKFWQNILGIEEIKFSLYIHSKLGSLCRFFKFSHFLVAFSLKVHGQVDFLLSTQIKPGSAPGEVCRVMT